MWAFFATFSVSPIVFAEQKIVIGASRFAVKSLQGQRSKVVPDRGLVWIFTRNKANGGLWRREEIVDKDSEVIHRAKFLDWDGSGRKRLLTAGANRALLKLYHPGSSPEILWNPLFTKQRSRLRDFRIADVNGDGRQEIIVGTHPKGVVAVVGRDKKGWKTEELSREERTWIHEIAVGHVTATSGPPDFFATFSQPNVAPGRPQIGRIVAWRWDKAKSKYRSKPVDFFKKTHAKEITVGDIDGDGHQELIASIEGVAAKRRKGQSERLKLAEPSRVVVYRWKSNQWMRKEIAIVPDLSLRSLAIGDADNDGRPDIVLGPRRAGIRILRLKNGEWKQSIVDRRPAGLNLPLVIGDLEGNGQNEILAASDFTGKILRYSWKGKGWKRSVFATIPKEHWTWSMNLER